jgi:hypothetical protein
LLIRLAAIFAFLHFATPFAYAENVYEWRDAQGKEHMSDFPPQTDQPGVELIRVNGKEVNSFHDDPAADESELASRPEKPSPTSQVPRTEEDCAEIHGRPCNWDEHWRGYAEANCRRVGDGYCGDDAHLRAHYDPRLHAARHAARARAHR